MKAHILVLCVGLFLCGCATDNQDDVLGHMIRVAKRARETGNSEAAINFYKKALEIESSNPQIYLGLSEVYIDMKLIDLALDCLKKAESYEAAPWAVSYLRGKAYLLSNNTSLAKKEFMKFDTVDCLNALGAIYDNSGDHKRAQSLYKQVIAKDPNYIDAYNNLGLSLMLSNKYNEAVFYLESACAFPNATVIYRSNLALAYGLQGNVLKAREVYAKDFDGSELEEKVAYIEDMVAKRNHQ